MGTVFLIAGATALVAGVVVFAVSRRRPSRWLTGTALLSAGMLAAVAGWLLTGPGGGNRGEALKTGGLAAGAVVALYALWLNDRRRRVEERRHDLEVARVDHDRERVADERFARAVELLGHDTDQVRVGAMHALAGLARGHERYTQTVLDILCAYLRRPVDDSGHEEQVRKTAQRLIRDLLPKAGTPDAPWYDLDLTQAELEYFDISERVVGRLIMRFTTLRKSNSMWGCRIHGNAWFTGAVSPGVLHAHDTVFHRKAWFSGFTATGPVELAGSRFLGPVKTTGMRVEEMDIPIAEIRTSHPE